MSQEKYEIFICHSRKDDVVADKVCAALDREGISYFINRQEIEECDKTLKLLTEKIANSKLFLLLASENSYGTDFILDQVCNAYYNAPMVTYVIDGARLPLEIDDLFGFMDWYDIDDHPIDTVLMDELRRKLGYGYRKSVFTEQEKFLLSLPDDEFERVEKSTRLGRKFGYKLKSTGEIVIPIEYDYCEYSFHEGLAMVKRHHDVGFVDKTGEEVVPLEYYDAKPFCEGMAAVYTAAGAGFVDRTGRVVTPLNYSIVESFSDGLAAVMILEEYRFGFINNKGEAVIPYKYNDAGSFCEGLAKVQIQFKGKYGYIDKNDNVVIPFQYDDANNFNEGLASVSINGKFGFIDKTGNIIIPCKYDKAASFSNGRVLVQLNVEKFWIDKEGNRIE